MYDWVKKYIGIPFCSGGRDLAGCDCYGLTRLILQNEYKINLPSLDDKYENALDKSHTKKLFEEFIPLLCGEKINAPEEKAVAIIRTQGLATHVALYAGDGNIIHTMLHTGSVCERLDSPMLTGRVEGWYRVSKSYCSDKSVFA